MAQLQCIPYDGSSFGWPGDGNLYCFGFKDSAVMPSEIDYINAHGSSTRMNDILKALPIKPSLVIMLINYQLVHLNL